MRSIFVNVLAHALQLVFAPLVIPLAVLTKVNDWSWSVLAEFWTRK